MRGTIEIMGNYATSRFNKKFEIASYPGMVTGFADVAKLIVLTICEYDVCSIVVFIEIRLMPYLHVAFRCPLLKPPTDIFPVRSLLD